MPTRKARLVGVCNSCIMSVGFLESADPLPIPKGNACKRRGYAWSPGSTVGATRAGMQQRTGRPCSVAIGCPSCEQRWLGQLTWHKGVELY